MKIRKKKFYVFYWMVLIFAGITIAGCNDSNNETFDPQLTLAVKAFDAVIVDNRSSGQHHEGYNGVAALIPRGSDRNIFVPVFSGLNYELISLTGLAPFPKKFEPRFAPMQLKRLDKKTILLKQNKTGHSHVSTRITFSVREPHYLDQKIEIQLHKRFSSPHAPNRFRSLWASYINEPKDIYIYTKPGWRQPDKLANWFGMTSSSHESMGVFQWKPLPADKEINAEQHHETMMEKDPVSIHTLRKVFGHPDAFDSKAAYKGPLDFYYGLYGKYLFLMMFKQPERARLAYSPTGGLLNNPAWDYVLEIPDAEVGKTYTWQVCLVVKPFVSRKDVLNELGRYLTP